MTAHGQTASRRRTRSRDEWFDAEIERRLVEDDPNYTEQLVRPQALPGTYGWLRQRPPKAPRKQPESRTLRGILSRSCSGWPNPPDAIEAEKAIKSRAPTRRTKAVVETVLCESKLHELMQGEEEQAWSLQDLCWWMHSLSIGRADLVRLLNAFSEEFIAEESTR